MNRSENIDDKVIPAIFKTNFDPIAIIFNKASSHFLRY